MELTELKTIGLTEGEIKLYNALLELGESTRTELSKKSGISPSKIYDVANRLLEKGIISSIKKNNIIHFIAADPERLKNFLQQKELELQKGDFNYVFGASQGHDSKQADIFFSQYYKKKITKIQCFS